MNVTVNAGLNKDEVNTINGVHDIIKSQLDLLMTVHNNIKTPTHVTGISISNCENTTVDDAYLEGLDVGISVSNSESIRLHSPKVKG